ncbi:MAG: hypothetical protein ACP5UN_02960 [Candidatus Micrarchaeia archaeon]
MLESKLNVCNIIIDTSSILFGFAYNKNIFETIKINYPNCKIIISKGIIRELTNISKSTGKRGMSAKTALKSIKHSNFVIEEEDGNVDEWIYNRAQQINAKVITNDTELIKRLKYVNINCAKMTMSGVLK